MFAATIPPEVAFAILSVGSVIYVVLAFLILRWLRALELKLLAIGLLTAVLAVWSGQLTGPEGAAVQVRPGGLAGEVSRVSVGSEAAWMLGRIAFVLILGAVAVSIFGQSSYRSVSPNREEAIRERPL